MNREISGIPVDQGMKFDRNKPYNTLPPLPPPVDLESGTILKKCIGAHRALASLKGAGNLIPNQAILINAIPLQEAKASSAIENLVTTGDKLYQASGPARDCPRSPDKRSAALPYGAPTWRRAS